MWPPIKAIGDRCGAERETPQSSRLQVLSPWKQKSIPKSDALLVEIRSLQGSPICSYISIKVEARFDVK